MASDNSITVHRCVVCGDWERELETMENMPCIDGGDHARMEPVAYVAVDALLGPEAVAAAGANAARGSWYIDRTRERVAMVLRAAVDAASSRTEHSS